MDIAEKKRIAKDTLTVAEAMIRGMIREKKAGTHSDNYHDMLVAQMTLQEVLQEIKKLKTACEDAKEEE